jgi:antitoxin SocA-like protein
VQVRNPKLCKALETLVATCGSIDGRTRMVKLVYLTDKAWYAKHGEQYTEASYFRWNHGPYAREVLHALAWMDGVEIVETEHPHPNGMLYTYEPGKRSRLGAVTLDEDFRKLLLETAKKWRSAPLKTLLAHVYADTTFNATIFGDRLLA